MQKMMQTRMKPIDVTKAIFYPVTEFAVLVPLVFFTLLSAFAYLGGILGVLLMIVIFLAVFRYQMTVLEARAKGKVPETPGVEFFNWIGNGWSLFPVPLTALIIWAVLSAAERFGGGGALVVLLVAGAFLPASFAVLAITHSPLQSINPIALSRLLTACGDTFWIASVYLVVSGWLSLQTEFLPLLLANFIQLFLTFSFFSLTGSLIEPYGLIDDVRIPNSPKLSEQEVAGGIEKERASALSHAYGFMSRGNRDGGFNHILDHIGKDPDPVAAWVWFFDRMLLWENTEHALFFAQLYVHDMLQHGEKIPALKVIMRCRLINEQFKPKKEDMPAAIQAAAGSGNIELAAVLKRP